MKRVIGMVSIVLIAAACSWTYAVPTAAPSPAPLPTATAAAPAYDPVADEDPPLRIGSLREQLASEYAVVRVPAAEGLPEHHAVVLDGWTEPVLHLFAVDALRAAQPTADGLIEALLGDLETVEDVPVPDFMPPYSAGLLTAGRLATYNNGIGYVVQIVEPNAPANVHMLLYTFVGLTPDGRYLLVGTFPLEHPVYGQVPASREELTDTNSGDFTPSIAPLLAFYNTVTVPGATAESSTATCTFNPMIWSALDGLTWEQVEGGRLLLGLPLPVLDILPTPAGEDRILAVMQLNEPRESGVPATLAALDPDGSAHQWLNNLYDHSQDAEVVGWLPDGDMVWLDEEGAVRREGADMEAPVRMRSVWAMAAGTVIAVPANWDDPEVYRWSPESGWAAIESPDERSLVGSQMAASRDDSFVLSVGFTLGYGGNPAEVHVRRIPGEAGAPGELAGTLTGYIYSTGGGFPPVVQFGDTSLWHVPMPLGDDEGMWTGYLDATTGQPVDPLAVFPGPFAGAGGLTSLDIAPDGRWLLWRFHEESFDEPPVQIAIAPVEDPTSAEIVEGADLMGWGPDYVILWPADDNQRTSMAEVWITALPLSGPVHPLDGFSYIINLAEDLLIGVPVDPAPGGPDLRTLLTITPEGDRRTISLPDTVTLLSEYGRFGPGAGGTLIAVEDAPALMDDGRCRHPYGIFAVDR